MKEKVLDNKKNGMGMMVLFILLYAVAAAAVIFGAAFEQIPLMVIGIIWASLGWIPFLGLKVLKPQEALVLTLFGKYVGTLKNDGFYWVNPFCTAVNPAAKTRLNQSGDVDGGNAAKSVLTLATGTSASTSSTYVNKKISLKIMTLNNNRQKINDCLGNPVEIGIAVMWRVTDTAKAVFNVDNYTDLDSGIFQESPVNTNLTELILDQNYLLTFKCFFQQFLNKSCLTSSKETGDNVNLYHFVFPFLLCQKKGT